MTMRDPDLKTRTTVDDRRTGSSMGWIIGAIVVLLLVGALAFTWSNDSVNTAGSSNPNQSAPSTTTGSAAPNAPASGGGSNVPPAGAPAR